MPTIFQIPTFIQILEFIGTFAFAISGIRLASAKQFDWFGAYVAGVAVAIGGGTIRDVFLDDESYLFNLLGAGPAVGYLFSEAFDPHAQYVFYFR